MHPRTYHSADIDERTFTARHRADLRERESTKPRLLPVEKEWSPYPVAKEQK